MATERAKVALPPSPQDPISSAAARRGTVSMLGRTYGCGQCSGKFLLLAHPPFCAAKTSMRTRTPSYYTNAYLIEVTFS